MSEKPIIITEQYGSVVNFINNYSEQDVDENSSEIVAIPLSNRKITASVADGVSNFFREILLPHGYPASVSDDYFEYQLWDSIQAFCSTITGIFTTQAILKGVGVGNVEASALSATITWIMKDGTGLIGRIVFAWWKGNGLDCDCKKWRLFADFINDLAMILELSITHFTDYSTQILCISTALKSVVGVAGGATRAAIVHHQAVKENMAEISAKDSSQETLVNLVASITAIFLLNFIVEPVSQWMLILLLISFHLYTNYCAVTALIFKNLNIVRLSLLLKSYLVINTVLSPQRINQRESVILGFGNKVVGQFCGFKVKLAKSFRIVHQLYKPKDLKKLLQSYENRKYILVPDIATKTIYVFFENGEQSVDVIAAYYNAVLLGIATSIYNNLSLDIYAKRQLHHTTPITRLCTFMKSYQHNFDRQLNIPVDLLVPFSEFVDQEIEMFFTALDINGWKTSTHSIMIDEWRVNWKLDRTNKKML